MSYSLVFEIQVTLRDSSCHMIKPYVLTRSTAVVVQNDRLEADVRLTSNSIDPIDRQGMLKYLSVGESQLLCDIA